MRNINVEDDVVCVEVGCVHLYSSLKLQAPSHKCHKYGKLDKRQLLKVDPYLVKRSIHHILYIESLGIDLILGHNGYIWIGEHVQVQDPMIVNTCRNRAKQSHTPFVTRLSILRIENTIRVLSNLGFAMTLEVIMETCNLSNTVNIDINDMIGSEFHVLVADNEADRRIRRA